MAETVETPIVETPETQQVPLDKVDMQKYKEARKAGATETVEVAKPAVAKEEETEEEVAVPPAPGEEKTKGGGKFQKRYDHLYKLSKTLETQLAEEKKARMDLEARVNGKEPAKTETKPAEGEPKQEDYKTIEEYFKALTRWEMKQANKEESERAEKDAREAAEAEINSTHKERTEAARIKYDDYDEKLASAHDVPAVIVPEIKQMENGPEVAYYLATHPEICDKMLEMTQGRSIAEAWKISEKLGGESKEEESEEEEEKEAKPVTKAAAPIKPVNGSSTRSSVPLDKLDMQEYKKARKAGRVN